MEFIVEGVFISRVNPFIFIRKYMSNDIITEKFDPCRNNWTGESDFKLCNLGLGLGVRGLGD